MTTAKNILNILTEPIQKKRENISSKGRAPATHVLWCSATQRKIEANAEGKRAGQSNGET